MKVSIIIPAYNIDKHLPACLDSVLSQTFENFELIIIDDGSSDNTPHVCDEYKANDTRIKTIHKSNGGVSSARNIGIDAAQGDWITFIDGDDIIEPDYLERLISEAEEAQTDMVCCNIDIINLDKRISKHPFSKHEVYSSQEICSAFFSNQTVKTQFYSPVNKIIRRSIIGNLRFKNYALGEDLLFIFELLSRINRVSVIPFVGYHYIKREGSATTSSFSTKKLDYIKAAHIITELSGNISPEIQKEAKIWTMRHIVISLRQIYKNRLDNSLNEYVRVETKFLEDNKQLLSYIGFKRRVDYYIIKYLPKTYTLLPI